MERHGAATEVCASLVLLVEDDGDIHARIRLLAARVSMTDDRCRVIVHRQRTGALIMAQIQTFGSLNLQAHVVSIVRPRTDTAIRSIGLSLLCSGK